MDLIVALMYINTTKPITPNAKMCYMVSSGNGYLFKKLNMYSFDINLECNDNDCLVILRFIIPWILMSPSHHQNVATL